MIEMTEEQKKVFFQNWHNQWIQPELDRRFSKTELPTDFKIRQCLVKLPKNQKPIVEINDEVGWAIENPHMANGKNIADFEFGEPVFLHDFMQITKVLPPTITGERIAFMYLFWDGFTYQLYVDFLPNQEDFDPDDKRFQFDGRVIVRHLQNIIIEKATRLSQIHLDELRKIGLWTATALLPYPISKILERISESDFDGAIEILSKHCDTDFLTEKVVETWHPINVFSERMSFFEDSLFCHENERYHASISTMVGQIEGVITDWLYEIDHYQIDKKRNITTKIHDFRVVLDKIPSLLEAYREARDSMLDFLDSDPWLQTFNKWMVYSDTSFAGRHVVQHGKYDHAIYTKENSIKLFLLLDNICQFMMFYEVRVLGRDLGQNNNVSN